MNKIIGFHAKPSPQDLCGFCHLPLGEKYANDKSLWCSLVSNNKLIHYECHIKNKLSKYETILADSDVSNFPEDIKNKILSLREERRSLSDRYFKCPASLMPNPETDDLLKEIGKLTKQIQELENEPV